MGRRRCLGMDAMQTTLLLGGSLALTLLFTYPLAAPHSTGPLDFSSQRNAAAFKTSADPVTPVADTVRPPWNGGVDTGNDGDFFGMPAGFGDGLFGGSSLASADWLPQTYNPTPISEITIMKCVFPPAMGHLCTPKSTLKETTMRGNWIRVTKDLNRRVGIYYLFVFYRRLPRGSSYGIVTNATILTSRPTISDLPASPSSIWVEVSTSLRTGVWPKAKAEAFLHYRLSTQAEVAEARRAGNGDAGDLEPFTEIDVLYGKTHAPWGFKMMRQMVTGGVDDSGSVASKGNRAGVSLAVRKRQTDLPPVPTLEFSTEGNFTILQVADLHLSTGPGACRDLSASQVGKCEALGADEYSLRLFRRGLDELEKEMGAKGKGLVVFTGDQLNGQDTSWSAQSTLLKFAPLVWERKLPWTTIFGNHDGELDLSIAAQMELMVKMPYFIGEAGDAAVDGTGNYMRGIKAGDESNTTLFNLYFLDSHANAAKGILSNPFKSTGYDWIKPNQINWFRSQSAKVGSYLRPYVPPAVQKSRPIPTYSKTDPFDDRRRSRSKRQLPSLQGENDNEDFGIGNTMIPDDGSRVTNTAEELTKEMDKEEKEEMALLDGGGVDGLDGDFRTGFEQDSSYVMPVGPTIEAPLLAKPNAMAFFHIPLLESYESPIDKGPDGQRLKVGNRYEGNGASKFNSQFFSQALQAQKELIVKAKTGETKQMDEFWDNEFENRTEGRSEVKVVVNGHCHLSNDCRRIRGVWLCFGGGGSYSGYGKPSVERTFRMFQISKYGEKVESYKLTDEGTRKEHIVLVGP